VWRRRRLLRLGRRRSGGDHDTHGCGGVELQGGGLEERRGAAMVYGRPGGDGQQS
jgi:hypothetical protein